MKRTTTPSLLLAALSIAGAAHSQTVSLTPVPDGAVKKIGFYVPQKLDLTSTAPPELKMAPSGLHSPLYGVLHLQGKSFVIIIDTAANNASTLYVDSEGNGVVSSTPATEWKDIPYPSTVAGAHYDMHTGKIQVKLKLANQTVLASLGAYRFDPNDAKRATMKTTLLYYPDFAVEGKATIAGKQYPVMLADESGKGEFLPVKASTDGPPGVMFLIDRQGDGKFGQRGNAYDAAAPFNLGGTTYELSQVGQFGDSFKVVKSAKTVEEVVAPVTLSDHQKAIVFKAKTTDGKDVSFPQTYKGKIVLLDFWATWCGPCMQEVPTVVSAYKQYHPAGFEILGISLDNEKTAKDVPSVTKAKGMTWEQVCDAKYWEAAVAKLYSVQSIPQAYLVDGDTGEVLAEGDEIRGEGLAKAIAAAVAKKKATKTPK